MDGRQSGVCLCASPIFIVLERKEKVLGLQTRFCFCCGNVVEQDFAHGNLDYAFARVTYKDAVENVTAMRFCIIKLYCYRGNI